MSVVLPPQQLSVLPPAALFTDTPSRHPCKITVASSEKRRFQYNPYKGLRAPTLTQQDAEEDDDTEESGDDAISAALAKEAASKNLPEPMVQTQSVCTNIAVTVGNPAAFVHRPAPVDESFNPVIASPPQSYLTNNSACLVNDGTCLRMLPGSIVYATVRFKFTESAFYVPASERSGLAIGDLVVVQGDRGEDIGMVTGDVTMLHGTDPNPTMLHVVRRALNKDRKRYFAARRKEAYAAKIAVDLAREQQLKMTVLDCEFQADLQKLTIFYRPAVEGLIDFRQLQRSLFKHFRCRIWLLNWDSEFQQLLEQQRQNLFLAHGAAMIQRAGPMHIHPGV